MRQGVVRTTGQRALVAGARLPEAPLFLQHLSEVVIGERVVRVDLKSRFEGQPRRFRFAFAVGHNAVVVVQLGARETGVQSRAILRGGILGSLHRAVQDHQVDVRLCERGIFLQGPHVQGHGVPGASRLHCLHASLEVLGGTDAQPGDGACQRVVSSRLGFAVARVQIEMLRGPLLLAQLPVGQGQGVVRLTKRGGRLDSAAEMLDGGFQVPGGRFRLAQAVQRAGVVGIGRDEFAEHIAAEVGLVAGKQHLGQAPLGRAVPPVAADALAERLRRLRRAPELGQRHPEIVGPAQLARVEPACPAEKG